MILLLFVFILFTAHMAKRAKVSQARVTSTRGGVAICQPPPPRQHLPLVKGHNTSPLPLVRVTTPTSGQSHNTSPTIHRRTVRILLECFLVQKFFFSRQQGPHRFLNALRLEKCNATPHLKQHFRRPIHSV